MLEIRQGGLYCPAGDFYIDPILPAERALITHAHSDHARIGSRSYLTAREGEALLRDRLGEQAAIQCLPYGERLRINDVDVSFHPSGHILGAAQIRLERAGEIWVVSGDYKLAPDPTCAPFEPIRCHTFVTESTFALPIFRWGDPAETIAQIHDWWRENREAGRASVLYAYPLGKAQRLLAALDPTAGPIVFSDAIERLNAIYRAAGVALPHSAETKDFSQALIIGPANLHGSPWVRRFGATASTAFASGWMRIRGARRRRSLDRGFVLSDHAGWNGLQTAIAQTGAEIVWTAHGFTAPLAHWLTEQGKQAVPLELAWPGGEASEEELPE